jgi:hypothetical protein
MSTQRSKWYAVPEVWLMIIMLGATVTGSLALVATAFGHRDDLVHAGPAIAAPLPPSTAVRPADSATP